MAHALALLLYQSEKADDMFGVTDFFFAEILARPAALLLGLYGNDVRR